MVSALLLAAAAWMFYQRHQTPTEIPDDQRIFTEVRRRIQQEGRLKDDNLAVAVQAKVVTLQGEVRTQEESDIASVLANAVEGVVGVQNLITVHEAPKPQEPVAQPAPKTQGHAATASKTVAPVAAAPQPAASSPEEEATQSQENSQAAQAAKNEQDEGTRGRIVGNLVKKGYQNLQNGKYRLAAGNFRTALEIAPGNQNAQLGLERAQEAIRAQGRATNRFAR